MSIEPTTGSSLTLQPDQEFWTDKQVAALRQLGVDRATNGDLAVFLHVAQRTGLDPFARQIYMIERQGKQTIQTGIDGMRLVARRAVDRSGETLAISAPEWCGPDGQWTDVWLSDGPPAAARVTVTRGTGQFAGVALWREYVQTKRNGEVTQMWLGRPAGQLAKCAEALALRKACPQDLSGVYAEEELAREDRTARSGGVMAVLRRQETSGVGEGVGEAPDPTPDPDPEASDEPAEVVESEPMFDYRSSWARGVFFPRLRAAEETGRVTDPKAFMSEIVGRDITSSKELTEAEAERIAEHLPALSEPTEGAGE